MTERNIEIFAAKLSDSSLGKITFGSIAVLDLNAQCLPVYG